MPEVLRGTLQGAPITRRWKDRLPVMLGVLTTTGWWACAIWAGYVAGPLHVAQFTGLGFMCVLSACLLVSGWERRFIRLIALWPAWTNALLLAICGLVSAGVFLYSLAWMCIAVSKTSSGSAGAALLSVLSVVAYIACARFHPVFKYLRNLNPVEDVMMHIRKITATEPSVWFSAACYHYEEKSTSDTESYTDWETDSDGNSRSSIQYRSVDRRETVRVDHHYETERFRFTNWCDKSAKLDASALALRAVRIDFHWEVLKADHATVEAYAAARNAFRSRHQYCDDERDFRDHAGIAGFKHKMMSVVDLASKPWQLREAVYMLSAAFGLLAVYLVWIERNTTAGTFVFTKMYSVAPRETPSSRLAARNEQHASTGTCSN